MPELRHLLMAEVTDPYGEVESEPIVVALQGLKVRLELHDGTVYELFAAELRGALVPEPGEQAA